MTIPFLDFFKKLTGRAAGDTSEPSPVVPPVRPKKSDAERLRKTVMPNATRSFSPADPFRSAAAVATPRSNMPLELGARRITASPARARAAQLPPALARALEPKIERTISLRVADLIDSVPAGFIKPVEILDANAIISLKASEIEKGMPDKHPMISLPSLYQQVPEIFLRSVRPDDDGRVELPYQKVLEQFLTAQVRTDQERDPEVPQLKTPILSATIEDSQRFGTKIEPIETSPLPAVPVRPATAESIAEAEPDATPATPISPAKLAPSGQRVISLHSPELKPTSEVSKSRPTSIESKTPLQLSPNGTGAPASERVPASSGPPVPTPLPFTPELPKLALKLPVEESVEPPAKARAEKPEVAGSTKAQSQRSIPIPPPLTKPAQSTPSILLSLKAVLQNLPAFQLSGEIASVPDDAKITLPLGLIEPQLASGRVSISSDVFQTALPQEHRGLFHIDVAATPVALPLEEVLKNLPATVLKLRDDQQAIELDKDFETPFLLKAHEDAQRFAPKPEAVQKTPEKPTLPAVVKPRINFAEASGSAETVQTKPTAEKIDPKEIVAQANALAGVKACAVTFSDGLSLAGELPEQLEAEGLCAMAPSMLERIAQHVKETKLGEFVAMTLYTNGLAVSFFTRGAVCLTAVHESSLAPETRTRLAELAQKLSQTYAKPETPNVDH